MFNFILQFLPIFFYLKDPSGLCRVFFPFNKQIVNLYINEIKWYTPGYLESKYLKCINLKIILK